MMKLIMIFKLLLLSSFFVIGQGQIKFNTLEYNLEPASIGQNTFLKIPFSNIGNEPLIITKCQSANTTSIISSKKYPILPNESDTLHVKIFNNSIGDFKHSFVVGVNNQDSINVIKVNIKVVEVFKNDRKVYGKVMNGKTGESIPFANVVISQKGVITGTTTDFEGNYSLNVSINDTLIFSVFGMKTQKIKADKEEINIQLEEVELIIEGGPPYIPRQKSLDLSTINIPVKELKISKKRINNPKYDFRKNAKSNVYIIFVSELKSYDFNKEDLEFQQKYNVKYSSIGNYETGYLIKHNKLTFKYLKKKYEKTWLTKIRKDAIGLTKE